ncbi:MAG: hypothetical protein JSW41_05380 [Candidatus Aenigmatarchaeota archaeon]|nr:MAG: hypothetical protein JSW41_05380 [Candidatus Aenigmarchaeota archaeon]
MKSKVFILTLIFLFLISCEKGIENPYVPGNPNPLQANIEMVNNPSWYSTVYTTTCEIADWENNPYFGFMGYIDSQGNFQGVLKNTGNTTAYNVSILIKIFDSNWLLLGQVSIPSDDGCCHFFTDIYNPDRLYNCTLKPGETMAWRAFLLHDGNDWRPTTNPLTYTQYIIDWD